MNPSNEPVQHDVFGPRPDPMTGGPSIYHQFRTNVSESS